MRGAGRRARGFREGQKYTQIKTNARALDSIDPIEKPEQQSSDNNNTKANSVYLLGSDSEEVEKIFQFFAFLVEFSFQKRTVTLEKSQFLFEIYRRIQSNKKFR